MEYKSKKSEAKEINKAENNTAATREKNIGNDEIFVNDAEKEKDVNKIKANDDKDKERGNFFYFYFPIIVIGIGIGWLIGLSVSPVLNIILTGLITILASILTIISGISKSNAAAEDTVKDTNLVTSKIINVNLFPLMWLVIGIVSGSVSGIYTRNHDLIKMNEYSKYDGSISKEDFGKLLLCRDFPYVECKIYLEGFTSATPHSANTVTKNLDNNSASTSNLNSKTEQETNSSSKPLSSVSQSKIKVEIIPKSDSQSSKVTKNDEPKKESSTILFPNEATAMHCDQINGESLETLKSAMKRVIPRNKLNEFAETCVGTECFVKAKQICPDLKLKKEEDNVQK
jgi:hypothetical protein